MKLGYVLMKKSDLEKLMSLSLPYEQRRVIRKTIGYALEELKDFETDRDTKLRDADLVNEDGSIKKSKDENGNIIEGIQAKIIEINKWIGEALNVELEIPEVNYKFDSESLPSTSVYTDQIFIDFGLLEDN